MYFLMLCHVVLHRVIFEVVSLHNEALYPVILRSLYTVSYDGVLCYATMIILYCAMLYKMVKHTC